MSDWVETKVEDVHSAGALAEGFAKIEEQDAEVVEVVGNKTTLDALRKALAGHP